MPDQGILAQTQMPPFSAMGLLLGGRGYASGWFQTRDKLAVADAAIAKERNDRGVFAQGVLADPRYKNWLAHPDDRAAQGSLWSLLSGGPESVANMGNTMLTQGLGAIQAQELAGLQHTYQGQEQQQAHDFRLLEQTHGTDEAVRQQQQLNALKMDQIRQGYEYISKPDQTGLTPEQQQFNTNMVGDLQYPGGRQPGYDWVKNPNGGMIGQVPQRGTPERTKIEMKGNAYSNLIDMSTKHLWLLDNGQLNSAAAVYSWNSEVDSSMNYMRQVYEAGAMSQDDKQHYEDVIPKLKLSQSEIGMPDALGQRREQLKALREYSQRDLEQFARSTLVPMSTYTADDWRAPKNFQPGEVPNQADFNKQRDARQKRLDELGSRNERRIRAAPEYTLPERGGTFAPSLEYDPEKQRKLRSR